MSLKDLILPIALSAITGCTPAKSPQPQPEQFHYQCAPNDTILKAPYNSEEHTISTFTKQEILKALCASNVGPQTGGDEVACSSNLLKGHAKEISKMDALQNYDSRTGSLKRGNTYTVWANLGAEGNFSCTRVHPENK